MRHDPLYQPITVEQFLDIDFPSDRKYELVDGVIRMMTGGTPAHSRVASNILIYLGTKLRGSGRRPYNSDMGVRVTDTDVRYPDVSIYCGNPASVEREEERLFTDPVVLFEVLSASTVRIDEGEKLAQYRALSSVDTIVFVDPQNETSRVIQRLGPPHGATIFSRSRMTSNCPHWVCRSRITRYSPATDRRRGRLLRCSSSPRSAS